MRKAFQRFSLLLICMFCLTSTTFAQEGICPQSSLYIKGSSAEITPKSGGSLTISFWVSGTSAMTKIGASSIELYEVNGNSAELVKTFRSTDSEYSHLMGSNKGVHTSSVTFSGTVGCQYYAEVHLTAKNSSGSDSIVEVAPSVTAQK